MYFWRSFGNNGGERAGEFIGVIKKAKACSKNNSSLEGADSMGRVHMEAPGNGAPGNNHGNDMENVIWKEKFPQFGLFCDFPILFVLYNFGDQSTLQMNWCVCCWIKYIEFTFVLTSCRQNKKCVNYMLLLLLFYRVGTTRIVQSVCRTCSTLIFPPICQSNS